MSENAIEKRLSLSQRYQITVFGKVDSSWSEWFGNLKLTTSEDKDGFPITRLSGVLPDQGALRGVLNKLWDLNLSLLSVKCNPYSSRR